jgi:hypothetical protein
MWRLRLSKVGSGDFKTALRPFLVHGFLGQMIFQGFPITDLSDF